MNTLPVGSGCYTYRCNDEPAGVEETWEIRHRDGEYLVDSVRYARVIGTKIRVRSTHNENGFSSCTLHWRRKLTDQILEVSADYCFDNQGATVYIHNGSEEMERREPGADYLFSPLMRIYNGPVIQALCAGGESRVLVPWIKNAEQTGKIFHPHYSTRRASFVRDTHTRIAGAQLACKEYDYSGGEYQPGTRFWIDPDGVMLRYCWQQDKGACWEISLSDYQPA